jgi:hypothetical protein
VSVGSALTTRHPASFTTYIRLDSILDIRSPSVTSGHPSSSTISLSRHLCFSEAFGIDGSLMVLRVKVTHCMGRRY